MENVNYDVRDQFNQPLLNRAKLIEIIKEEREARERAEKRLREREEQIATLESALQKLVDWDKAHPRDHYYIAEYGAVRDCEDGLNAICDGALAALRKE